MRMEAKQLNRLMMMTLAPFIGLLLFLVFLNRPLAFPETNIKYGPVSDWSAQSQHIMGQLDEAENTASYTVTSIQKTAELYKQTTQTMNSIAKSAATQSSRPETIYNRRITAKLGTPYERVNSDRITIELFKVNPGAYKGYAMKVKLKDSTAMQMSLGTGTPGSTETTMRAVSRSGAVAGINAGGFADGGGKRYPLSTTIMNGKYVNGFQASFKDLTFIGLSQSGRLIGGKFANQAALDGLQPSFGATFVPVLIQNGQKLAIPAKWKSTPKRAPRTVIGNYKDDQLLIIVVDGYNEQGSSGATLEELQAKMFNLGVQNAYNLDGGGSSSMILNGRVVNKPSDGRLRPVPTHFLFFK